MALTVLIFGTSYSMDVSRKAPIPIVAIDAGWTGPAAAVVDKAIEYSTGTPQVGSLIFDIISDTFTPSSISTAAANFKISMSGRCNHAGSI